MPKLRIGFVQTSPVFGDIDGNVEDAVRRISRLDADIVVLPELFSTGYQFRSRGEARGLAEDAVTGSASAALAGLAAEKKIHIAAGLAERDGSKVYNSSILVGPRGVVSLYRKAHLFWNEKDIFSPGDIPFEVRRVGGARVGMMICFDWVFPEVARTLALKGAEIICHPSNLVLPHCPQAMITRCLENRVYAVTANRVGSEARVRGSRLEFIGSSEVVAPDGRVLVRAGRKRAEARVAEVDTALARDKRITPRNDLMKDRRPGIYSL